jgi:carboxyl-terminal processing protease
VVQVRDSSGEIKVNQDPNPDIAYTGPLVVLVDRFSASASEIFAGAMQDYRRALIVGEPTYGKGTVQNVVDLNNFVGPDVGELGQLKVTIAQFFRINGASTQHRGVVPDIVFPTAMDIETQGERALENALPWATVNAALFESLGLGDATVEKVRVRHEQRIEDDPGFSYLRGETLARQVHTVEVSLLESLRKSEIESREASRTERLNVLRTARGLEPLGVDDADSEDLATGSNEEEQPIDILLDETALILVDMIQALGDSLDLRAEVTAVDLTR